MHCAADKPINICRTLFSLTLTDLSGLLQCGMQIHSIYRQEARHRDLHYGTVSPKRKCVDKSCFVYDISENKQIGLHNGYASFCLAVTFLNSEQNNPCCVRLNFPVDIPVPT